MSSLSIRPVALILATLALPSCTSIVHREAVGMRQHALDYYNAQVMDNLISGSKGLLILHVDIDSLTSGLNSSGGSNLSLGKTSAESTEIAGAPLNISKITDAVTKPFTASGESSMAGSLTSVAKPSKDPYLYRSYLQFLCLNKPEGSLSDAKTINYNPGDQCYTVKAVSSKAEIPKDKYVKGTVTHAADGMYYYVPIDYRRAYFQLLLAVTGKLDPTEAAGGTALSTGTGSDGKLLKQPGFVIPGSTNSFNGALEDVVRDQLLRKGIE